MKQTENNINPSHYKKEFKDGTIFETIDVFQAVMTKDEFTGYTKGNALKYLSRANDKHDSPIEDIKKAKRNLDFCINNLEGRLASTKLTEE